MVTGGHIVGCVTGSDERELRGDQPNSPDAASQTVRHSSPSEAFSALSDQLRVNILRELSEHHRQVGDNTLGFAELRKLVEVEDSGRFRYHLKKLEGLFVEKTSSGYKLTHAGLKIVGAIISGTYTDELVMGPIELESDCPACDRSAVAKYEDGRCSVSCANDHVLFTWGVPPNATARTSLPEVVNLAELLAFQAIEQAVAGVCPECYDPISPQINENKPARPVFEAACDSCGAQIVGPIDFCLFINPEVAAFCQRHGHSLRDNHIWENPFFGDGSEMTATDNSAGPIHFELTIDGKNLSGYVTENGQVTTNSG